jgi:hypothetical protein
MAHSRPPHRACPFVHPSAVRITPEIANDALGDANRVVIDPDYNSTTGRSVRIIGFSVIADDIVTVIVLADEGFEYGGERVDGQREGPPPLQPRRTA